MKKLIVKTMKIDSLNNELKEEMWQLYESTYDFVNRDQFMKDLTTKNYVFVGFDKETGKFNGFSTVNLYSTDYLGRRVDVMFSGDTIIHPDYWGSKALHKEFIRFAYIWKLRNLGIPLYWNLIASGNRTYLAMARNCATYFPRYDRDTPEWEKGFIDHIGLNQFGERYDLGTGVIKVDRPEAVFKTHLAPFSKEVKALPEISFFIQKNKGYERGDELSCIAKFDHLFIVNFLKILITKKMSKIAWIPAEIPGKAIKAGMIIASALSL